MEFTIKLDRFEGPYTKLLELIEGKKLSITEFSLAQVADEYILYIKSLPKKDTVDISQFIVVASTLMLMKAKSLLPGVEYTEEEEKQIHDLEFKLELYKLLSQGVALINKEYNKMPLYTRSYVFPKDVHVFVPDERVTPVFLQSIMSLTLQSFVVPKSLVKVDVEQALRIENVIENLLERIQKVDVVKLSTLAGDGKTKEEQKKILIVSFIALLELVKSGRIDAHQDASGDVTITSSSQENVSPNKEEDSQHEEENIKESAPSLVVTAPEASPLPAPPSSTQGEEKEKVTKEESQELQGVETAPLSTQGLSTTS